MVMGDRFFRGNADKSFVYMHVLMSLLFLVLGAYIVLNNDVQRVIILFWCGVYLLGAVSRHALFAEGSAWRRLLPIVELVAVQGVISVDITGFGLSLIPILAIDLMHDLDLPDNVLYGAVVYLIYMWNYIGRFPRMEITQWVLLVVIGALQFTLFFGFGMDF